MRLIIVFAFIGIVAQTFFLPAIAFRLELNREVEAVPMCVNRDRPSLNCYGSCYINIHLEAALAQQKQHSEKSTLQITGQWLPQLQPDVPQLNLIPPISENVFRCFFSKHWEERLLINEIWRPPTSNLV